MILKEIQFNNFISYWGTATFRLWEEQANPSQLVMVLAPNGAGKTNFVRGLHFLCGSDPDLGNKQSHRLVSHRAAALAKDEGKVTAWVQATFEMLNETRTFRREVLARVVGGHAIKGEQKLYEVPTAGIAPLQGEQAILQWLGRFVPRGLEEFFFFEGEDLAKRLIHSGEGGQAAANLRRLLHEGPWAEALSILDTLSEEVGRDMRKATANDKQASVALQVAHDKERDLDQAVRDLAKAKAIQAELDREWNEVDAEIRQIPVNQSSGRLAVIQRELDQAAIAIEARGREHERMVLEFASTVGSSAGLPFLSGFFAEAADPLRKLKEKNVLPAEIATGFIERLLAQGKQGLCVCGRALDPVHDAEAVACLRAYLEQTLQAEAGEGLLELLNLLEGKKSGSFQERVESTRQTLQRLRSRMEVCSRALRDARENERDLRHQRGQIQVARIQELQQRQNALVRRREEAAEAVKRAQRFLESAEDAATKSATNLKNYQAIQQPDIRAFQIRRDRIAKIREAVSQLKERLHETALQGIKDLMAESYDPRVPDGSKAHLNRDTLLPSILQDGQALHALGGAQRQLLLLSFIRALAEVRLRIRRQLAELGIQAGTLEAQPFVLDSVFGVAADQLRTACAELVASSQGQRVVLVANQQWVGSVREVLEPLVTLAYALRIHTPQEAVWTQGAKMAFRNQEVSVIEPLEEGDRPYTSVLDLTSA